MKKIILVFIMFMLFTAYSERAAWLSRPLFDLNNEKRTTLGDILPDLKKSRIILVGEHHGTESHHQAQLTVIRALYEAGANVAIGLEMFRHDSQQALNRWVSGDMEEKEFQEIYRDNWNFSWDLYGMIFKYAREKKMPMIGLNISSDIPRQVSREGFQSLAKDERGQLSDVVCRVDKEYMDFIRKAYGEHAHGKMKFTYFCEAQLVWDNIMAINALNYIKANPEALVVILTGTGHARKAAIPHQIEKRSPLPYRVILPEVPGVLDPRSVTKKDADYLMLDL